jgi:hypothetical protein
MGSFMIGIGVLMSNPIRFIDHQGKRILFVDFSNRRADEVEKIARLVPEVAELEPRNSILLLADFTEAVFDENTIRALKEAAVFDKPYVKKSALLGTDSFPRSLHKDMTNYSRRSFSTFETRDEALAWLLT